MAVLLFVQLPLAPYGVILHGVLLPLLRTYHQIVSLAKWMKRHWQRRQQPRQLLYAREGGCELWALIKWDGLAVCPISLLIFMQVLI